MMIRENIYVNGMHLLRLKTYPEDSRSDPWGNNEAIRQEISRLRAAKAPKISTTKETHE